MKRTYFITSTDTDAGKTYTTVHLLKQANKQRLKTAALKPIACGSEQTPDGLRNGDALQLQQAMSMKFAYDYINPYNFEPPISPHILTAQQDKRLNVKKIIADCRPVLDSDYNLLLIEGISGWNVPLNDTETTADLALAFGFPILLVIGIKLGCLNHSLLTWENMQKHKAPIAGWIANCLDPTMLCQQENIDTIAKRLETAPLLTLRYQEPPDTLAPWIFSSTTACS